MGIFDDSAKLFNRSFPWGMSRYNPALESYDLDSDIPPPDADSISMYIGEDGLINVSDQFMVWAPTDPISAPTKPTFTASNPFIEALKEVINPFPIFGVLLFPTMLPGTVEVVDDLLGTEIGVPTQKTTYPDHTPAGFVPCAGQLLKYADGRNVAVPNLASQEVYGGAGDGAGVSTQYFAPPGMAYMMKVEPGWLEMVPDLNGKDLEEFGTPSTPTVGPGGVPIV